MFFFVAVHTPTETTVDVVVVDIVVVLFMSLFWSCLLFLIKFHLLEVNKCSSEAPESFY